MQFRLAVRLSCAELETPRVNDWRAWAYPRAATLTNLTTPVYASPRLLAELSQITESQSDQQKTLRAEFSCTQYVDWAYKV